MTILALGRPGFSVGELAFGQGGGVSIIITSTIMRDNHVMRDTLRMTDNA